MSNPAKLGAICYEAENPANPWGEDVTTFATLRLPIIGMVDCSGLKQDKLSPDRTVQRRQDGTQWILGGMSGSFKTKLYLAGHGSTTSGATAATLVAALLGKVIGNNGVSSATGTTATGGTALVPTTAAANGFANGSLARIGTLGDNRGNGQFVGVTSHAANALTLRTAIDNAPNAADVVYSAELVYPSESPTATTINALRFLLQTANTMYETHGVVATDIALSGFNAGEPPAIEITWEVAWWRYSTSTFPSTVATETFQPAVNAGGSLFVQDVGTVTRAKRSCRDLKVEWKLGVELFRGPGGVMPYQTLVGARRTTDEIKVSWTEEADANTLTPVLPGYGTGTVAKQVLGTLSAQAGSAVCYDFRNVCVTNVPVQIADQNVNRFRIEGMAYTGPTTTNDLTAAAAVIGLA